VKFRGDLHVLDSNAKDARLKEMVFELRTTGDPLRLSNTVRQIVHQVGPQVPLANMTTQSRRIDESILQERTFAQLGACFGGLALVMACVGLYGTMAYAVARRTGKLYSHGVGRHAPPRGLDGPA